MDWRGRSRRMMEGRLRRHPGLDNKLQLLDNHLAQMEDDLYAVKNVQVPAVREAVERIEKRLDAIVLILQLLARVKD